AAHEADGRLGDPREAAVAALEIGDRTRQQVPDVDRLAGLGLGGQGVVRKRGLTVEPAGGRLRAARERRMRGDVVDGLAFHPELAPGAAKWFEKLFAGDRGHLAREDRRKAQGCQGPPRAQGLLLLVPTEDSMRLSLAYEMQRPVVDDHAVIKETLEQCV